MFTHLQEYPFHLTRYSTLPCKNKSKDENMQNNVPLSVRLTITINVNIRTYAETKLQKSNFCKRKNVQTPLDKFQSWEKLSVSLHLTLLYLFFVM